MALHPDHASKFVEDRREFWDFIEWMAGEFADGGSVTSVFRAAEKSRYYGKVFAGAMPRRSLASRSGALEELVLAMGAYIRHNARHGRVDQLDKWLGRYFEDYPRPNSALGDIVDIIHDAYGQ